MNEDGDAGQKRDPEPVGRQSETQAPNESRCGDWSRGWRVIWLVGHESVDAGAVSGSETTFAQPANSLPATPEGFRGWQVDESATPRSGRKARRTPSQQHPTECSRHSPGL